MTGWGMVLLALLPDLALAYSVQGLAERTL